MISRLARWWLTRSERRALPAPTIQFDECPGCGGPSSHRVVAGFTDAVEAEMGGAGGTYMSADFCPEHCPGGCLQGCPTLVA